MTRHAFYGANTPNGFYSTFSDILFIDEAQRRIYLKGSSGSGKSTLMKKVGKIFSDKGMSVDYIHCSNNVDDLDGICVRDIGVSIVDGTAPHVCDPVLPIAIDEIFDTAAYIDINCVSNKVSELLTLQSQKKLYYDKAYNYLGAAHHIFLNNYYIYAQALNKYLLENAIEKELEVFNDTSISENQGRNRRFFAEAITPQGYVNFIDTLTEGKTVVMLNGSNGAGTELMLEALKNKATMNGFDTESGYYPLKPDKLEHLIIPKKKLIFTTMDEYYPTNIIPNRTIDFNKFLSQSVINECKQEINYNSNIIKELIQKAMDTMASQKRIHELIENIYTTSMDFERLSEMCEQMIQRLLKLV